MSADQPTATTPDLQTEEFRPARDYDGSLLIGYRVSNLGRIQSCRMWMRDGQQGEPVWQDIRGELPGGGYRQMELRNGGPKPLKRQAHCLVLLAFIGPPGPGQECRHLNGIRLDNRLSNLCWGTKVENNADQMRHGTRIMGSKVNTSKLSADDVRRIRGLSARGVAGHAMAREYGVSKQAIYHILHGRNWKYLP